MRVTRKFSVRMLFVLDQLVPPIIRDSKWFMVLPMRLVLKDAAPDFMTFKQWFYGATPAEIGDLYRRTAHVQELQGETDLNEACTEEILANLQGKKVLEVGCGRGYLAGKLAARNKVTGVDIIVGDKTREKYPEVTFVEAAIEKLPFKDNSFDVVVTTHTLEHVQNLPAALAELRRVAKKELVIVVPRQRPYKYTFSLHTQFFPYEWSLQSAFGIDKKTVIKNLDHDWYYHQKLQ